MKKLSHVLSTIMEELNGIKSLIRSNSDTKLMTIKDVSDYTQYHEMTIRNHIRDGSLRPLKRSGKKLFRKSDVDAWLQR